MHSRQLQRTVLKPHQLLTIAGASALALAVLGFPRQLAARDAPARPGPAPHTPAETAVGGGIVHLRSPGSLEIKVRHSSFRMGSGIPDILEAVSDCAREPLGHRCREELFSDELHAHTVTLPAYWLDRLEVTVAAYGRCVALRRCRPAPFAEGARRFDRPSYPMTLVSWEDARQYCRFRGARLPTEAEYERAARGTTGRRFPWGELWNARLANHGRLGLDATDATDGHAELAPVGAFPNGRTPDGFLDLAGNAAEWVSDYYATSYSEQSEHNPQGPSLSNATSDRVVRGGHYASGAPWLRGAARSHSDPTDRSPMLGFRCARSVPGGR
jgi:formylglycine-generating enzyme required for sulfatase activity